LLIFAALVAAANAGIIGAPAVGSATAPAYTYAAPAAVAAPTFTSQQSNIRRSNGTRGQESTYSKTIDTPFSSVSKSDVRVSNDALAYPAAPAYAYNAAPALAYHAAPAVAAAPALAYHAAPAVATAPALAYHAAPVAATYAAPVVKTAATAVAGHGLLGVAYSAAPAVAHMTYSNGLGIAYSY
jgi:hypothetical protein